MPDEKVVVEKVVEKKTFLQAVAEVKAGLKKRNFSESDFVSLFVAYLNDSEHVMKQIKYSESKDQVTEILRKPVEDFRAAMKNVIGDFVGNDADKKKDIEAKMACYKFKKSDWDFIYDFLSEFDYQFLKSGRKLRLFDREDVSASIFLREKKGGLKDVGNGRFVKTKDHMVLGQSSACPDWSKDNTDSKGKVSKVISRVVEETFSKKDKK